MRKLKALLIVIVLTTVSACVMEYEGVSDGNSTIVIYDATVQQSGQIKVEYCVGNVCDNMTIPNGKLIEEYLSKDPNFIKYIQNKMETEN